MSVIHQTLQDHINKTFSRTDWSQFLIPLHHVDVFDFMLTNVERHNITIGKLAANNRGVKLNLYYTPTVLTTNSLVFDKTLMAKWWESGYRYAKSKKEELMSEFRPDVLTDKEIKEGFLKNK